MGHATQVFAPWLAAVHIVLLLDLDNMPGMSPGIGNPALLRLFAIRLATHASW